MQSLYESSKDIVVSQFRELNSPVFFMSKASFLSFCFKQDGVSEQEPLPELLYISQSELYLCLIESLLEISKEVRSRLGAECYKIERK